MSRSRRFSHEQQQGGAIQASQVLLSALAAARRPRHCGQLSAFPLAFGFGHEGSCRRGRGGADTLVFCHPDRVWEQKAWGNAASLNGHPRNYQNLGFGGVCTCHMPAGKGTERMDLFYLLVTRFSHTSWRRTTFSISPCCCSSTCETTLKTTMVKPDREGRD